MIDKSTETLIQTPMITTPRQSQSPTRNLEEKIPAIIRETPVEDEDPPTPTPIYNPSPSPSPPPLPSPRPSIETPEPQPPAETAEPQIQNKDKEGGVLEIYPAKTESDLITVLHLITDSIAQQSQIATKSILYNPLYWLLMVCLFQYLYQALYYDTVDWIIILVLWSAILLCSRSGVKILVSGYIDEAEKVGRWSWLFGVEWITKFESDRYQHSFIDRSGAFDLRTLVWVSLRELWVRVPGGEVRYAEDWMKVRKKKRDAKSRKNWRRDSDSPMIGLGLSTKGRSDWEKYSDAESIQVAASEPTNDMEIEGLADGWLRDMIFVAAFKGKIAAALVMRAIPVDMDVVGTAHASAPLSSGMGQYVPGHVYRWKAVIRAWTVQKGYRGFGIGRNILQYAVEYTVDRGWEGPEFAVDHANSLRLLPAFLNGKVDRMEMKAREMLADDIQTYKRLIRNRYN
ncbi:uncharacterized protein N7483_012609 [Penicillium malachiteum]|uniref:uncharacterized protein n=1 Tax=Penicillium malachiteum TaxID=1324776 RepID=UPI002547C281|nr:uncharacterized protein N7483_012609 [Penicillium malachiteum]KAJ5715428.1 hypothetical protein N7483_012609 [Penicillium malachiteum]